MLGLVHDVLYISRIGARHRFADASHRVARQLTDAASQHNPHTPEPTSGPIVSLPTRVHMRGTASLAGLQPETCYRISALFTTPPPRALDRRLI